MALKLLDSLNSEEQIIKGYIAAANIPPLKVPFLFNGWNLKSDSALIHDLKKAGFTTEGIADARMHNIVTRFRQQTSLYGKYFAKRTKKTNVKTTVVISRKDPFTKKIGAAEDRWKKIVTVVQRVILIDAPSHYFHNTERELLFSLFLDDE